ncbi:tRNA (adenosine(37)-N6)-threonylcarbamoyltransferase complex transferase subunit TsaD [bacterium]|nr:tRNA (adenosine(37)-N6)-threonylcarbamoyltransferase complex transferase subunit TsaD [bacterium]
MIALGIDTSCDDTSVAVLQDKTILSNLISSHLVHREFGGVVPEYASRAHALLLYPITKTALKSAGIALEDIDLITVTAGPGLLGSILCGLSFAKGLSLASGKPLRTVDHLEGHIYSVLLSTEELEYPFLVLLISGGHTELVYVRSEFEYQEIGSTLDDACGEALDKVGKLMGLGYPAGPAIERMASGARTPVRFPVPNPEGLDFSYSGLKTAARNYLKKHPEACYPDVASGFMEAAFDHLLDRVMKAIDELKVRRLGLAGGVSINKRLRNKFEAFGKEKGFCVYAPYPSLCTDNAAMIAAAGIERFKAFGESKLDVRAYDRSSFAEMSA